MLTDLPPTRPGRYKRTTVAERVEAEILKRIRNGQYPKGSLLPGWRSLAAEYGVGPVAIAQTVKKLVADGVLSSQVGRGTFVTGDPVSDTLPQIAEPRGKSEYESVNYSQPPWSERLTRRRSIGILNTNEATSFGSMTIVRSIEKSLSIAGGTVAYNHLYSDNRANLTIDQALASLVDRGVEAIVVVEYHDSSPRTHEYDAALGDSSIPLIHVTSFSANRPVWNVYYDNFDGGYQAAQHLLDAGCSSFAFLAYEHNQWTDDRLAGMQTVLHREHIEGDRFRVRFEGRSKSTDTYYVDAARRSALALFADGVPDGIVAVNDHTASGVHMAADELGLTTGVDFQLIGYDDFDISRTLGLSSMRPPLDEMGQCAARLAIRALEGDPTRQRICLTSHLIARSSTNARIHER